jgi:hypothetical protein
LPKYRYTFKQRDAASTFSILVVLCVAATGCIIDVALPEPISYDPPLDAMSLSLPDTDTDRAITDHGIDSFLLDSAIQNDQGPPVDASMELPDALPAVLDASAVIVDAEIIDSMVDPPIDLCRQPIVDSGYQLHGFTFEIIQGTSDEQNGCVSAIDTDLLPMIEGQSQIRWTGEITSDQSGQQISFSIPNLDNFGCTQSIHFGNLEFANNENFDLGLLVGQTPFAFELSCSGNIPHFRMNFAQ